jgi:mercuric reductase
LKFDLVILGGGSAGFAAAIKASELKKRFAMVENGTIGGTCINVGCVPSKRLLTVSNAIFELRNQKFKGIKAEKPIFDFGAAINEKDRLVQSLRKSKYIDVLENLKNGTL